MSQDIPSIIEQLREKLPDYLALHGRTPNEKGKFKCPTGTHEDKHPSCGFVPGNTQVWHCHQCGASGNIFHAAEYLEALPSRGPDFRINTLKSLATRFSIEYDPFEAGQDDRSIQLQRIWHIINDAANILINQGDIKFAEERGWTEETCKQLGIATISFNRLRTELLEMGYIKSDLDEAGIDEQLFHEDGMTFVLRDVWGRPMGFATRHMKWSKELGVPKYVNTPSKVPIFNKKSNLYNIHNVRRRFREAIIVEGYACVATAWQAGIRNVVATCGSNIAHEQADLLSESFIGKAILAFDADPAGKHATTKALEEIFGGRDDIRIHVLNMEDIADSDVQPKNGPLRKNGHCDLDELLRIQPDAMDNKNRKFRIVDPFDWRLQQFHREDDMVEVAEKMIPIIINEPMNIRRETLVTKLANFTSIERKAIQRDLDAIINKQDLEVKNRVSNITEATIRRLRTASPANVQTILEEAADNVDKVYEVVDTRDRFSANETLTFIDETKSLFENADGRLRGLDSGFEGLNRATLGIPHHGRIIGIPAQPNVGKTGFVTAIGWNTLRRNKDHIVLHYSIDDSRDVVLARLVAMAARVPIDIVTQPKKANDKQRKAIEMAWEAIRYYIENGRYDLRDASQGTDLDYLHDWCVHVHEENPEKPLLVIFDNFHKLQGPESDERIKFKNASQALHRMKNNPRCGRPTFLATMEMIKTRDRQAGVFDIAETNQILYDADMVIVMHSEFIDSGENAMNYWNYTDTYSGEILKQPMVKVIVEKNKISGFKGVFWLKFLARQSYFEEDQGYMEKYPEKKESKW